jgi:hypothetical protein
MIVAALVATAILVRPPVSEAGTYDVYSCRLPDGAPAAATGWSQFGTDPAYAANGCANGGAMSASLHLATLPAPLQAGWRFQAPADTTIEGVAVRRAAFVPSMSNGQSVYYYAAAFDTWPSTTDHDERVVERCVWLPGEGCDLLGVESDPTDESNLLESSAPNASELSLGIACHTFTGDTCWQSASGAARLTVFASRVTLRDMLPPEFSGEPMFVYGAGGFPTSVTFVGIDRGAGLGSTTFKVDDREVSASDLQLVPPCAPPYTGPVPCPLRRETVVPVSALGLTPGEHTLQVLLSDAAGNGARSKVVRITVPAVSHVPDAVPQLAELGATAALPRFVKLRSWFAGSSRVTTRTLKYGQRATVQGVLTDVAGAPVRSAELRVEERSAGAGVTSTVRTDAKGRFSFRLGAGPSRVVEVSYRAAANDPAPVAIARVNVRVRAGVTLHTSTRRVRNGTALRFYGRVRGERGTRRALVTIYALSGGRRARIPVETVRARSDGRFSYTYRFGSMTGPSVYRFEARVPRQTGFPYLEGVSQRVTVRGRP